MVYLTAMTEVMSLAVQFLRRISAILRNSFSARPRVSASLRGGTATAHQTVKTRVMSQIPAGLSTVKRVSSSARMTSAYSGHMSVTEKMIAEMAVMKVRYMSFCLFRKQLYLGMIRKTLWSIYEGASLCVSGCPLPP